MQNPPHPESNLKKIIFRFGPPTIAIVLLLAGVTVWTRIMPASERTLRHEADVVLPDGTTIEVQLADQATEQERGLGGLNTMKETQGFLFLFRTPSRDAFWMKDMKFPIDIIWIHDDIVVDSKENAPVPIGPIPEEIYIPEADAETVLELTAGSVARHGLKNGTRLDIRLPAGYSLPTN